METQGTMYAVPIYRVTLVREGVVTIREAISNSSLAEGLCRPLLAGTDREQFLVVMLDGKNKPIGINVVSVGTLTASLIHPREVFKPAILSSAAAVIFVHNHPSGDAEPSFEDRAVTKRLCEGGTLLGIKVLDHVILGEEGRRYSFADHGEL